MYKQIFSKSDGLPMLIETDDFDTEIYTDVQPPNGLYQPIHFDGNEWVGTPYDEWVGTPYDEWVGTPYEEWLEQQPKIEVEETPDDKDVLIADLTLQLMETQNTVVNLQNDMANLTLQVLESDINA